MGQRRPAPQRGARRSHRSPGAPSRTEAVHPHPDDAGRALPPGPTTCFRTGPCTNALRRDARCPHDAALRAPMRPAASTRKSRGPCGPGLRACSRKSGHWQGEPDDDAAPTSADMGQTRARSLRGPNAPLLCAKSKRGGLRLLPSSPEAELRDAKQCGVAPAPPAQHPSHQSTRDLSSPLDETRPVTADSATIFRAPIVALFLLSCSVVADLRRC